METQRNVEPWWKTRNVPWRGVLFQDMILKEDDPEEMRIQKIRKPMLKRYQDGKKKTFFSLGNQRDAFLYGNGRSASGDSAGTIHSAWFT